MSSTESDLDDDQRWLDLMAGRAATEARAATRVEAAWLRAAMLAYKPSLPEGRMPEPAARAQRLLGRAAAAGLFPAPSSHRWWLALGSAFGRTGAPLRWAGAAAALVLGIAWVMRLSLPMDEPEVRIERGAAVQVRSVDDPLASRQQMQAALQAAGLVATAYDRLGRAGLDIELPQALQPAQRDALKRLSLQPVPGQDIRLEFVRNTDQGKP